MKEIADSTGRSNYTSRYSPMAALRPFLVPVPNTQERSRRGSEASLSFSLCIVSPKLQATKRSSRSID